MPLSKVLTLIARTCPHCRHKAGVFRRIHPECRDAAASAWDEMVSLAAFAANTNAFEHRAVHQALTEIAARTNTDDQTVAQALTEGYRIGISPSLYESVLTQTEDKQLQELRDALSRNHQHGCTAALQRAEIVVISRRARRTALATEHQDTALAALDLSLRQSSLTRFPQHSVLVEAWEAAVETTLEDRLITAPQETALHRYMEHYRLTEYDTNQNGRHTALKQSSIIRHLTEGTVPTPRTQGTRPFNLTKTETLLWTSEAVSYSERQTREPSPGIIKAFTLQTPHGTYHPPNAFRTATPMGQRSTDSGTFGIATNHIYFAGHNNEFRIRYDRIAGFHAYHDGFSILRTTQRAKTQYFRTGADNSWFLYNVILHLSQLHGPKTPR